MIKAISCAPAGSLAEGRAPYLPGSGTGGSSSLAFKSLVFLIFVIYVGPQILMPALEPLHLAMVSAVLAIVASGKVLLSQGRSLIVLHREMKLIVWLVAMAILSIPLSKWPGGSWESFSDLYSKSVIVFFLVAILLDSVKRFHQFFWAIAIFTAFNAVTGLNNYRTGNFLAYDRIFGGASGIASNPNSLALVLNLAIPFVGHCYVTSKAILGKMLAAGILAVSVAGIVVTNSRGGFLTLGALLLWFVYVKATRQGTGAFIRSLAMIIAVLVMLFAFGPEGYADRILSAFDTSMDKTGSADTRWRLMIGAAQSVMEHPLGNGLHMHNLVLQKNGLGWAGVHNVYLEYAADLGLIGGTLFVVILWKLLASMRRIGSSPTDAGSPVFSLAGATEAALVAFAVGAFFHPVAYHFYFYIIAGIAVAVKEMARHEIEEHVMPSLRQRRGQARRLGP